MGNLAFLGVFFSNSLATFGLVAYKYALCFCDLNGNKLTTYIGPSERIRTPNSGSVDRRVIHYTTDG